MIILTVDQAPELYRRNFIQGTLVLHTLATKERQYLAGASPARSVSLLRTSFEILLRGGEILVNPGSGPTEQSCSVARMMRPCAPPATHASI